MDKNTETRKTLNELRDEIHGNAVRKGFYDVEIQLDHLKKIIPDVNDALFAQKMALIHSEVSETLEAHRKGCFTAPTDLKQALSTADKPHIRNKHFQEKIKNTVEDELADIIIRTLDICGHLSIDIEKHVELKMQYNRTRTYRHGKKY